MNTNERSTVRWIKRLIPGAATLSLLIVGGIVVWHVESHNQENRNSLAESQRANWENEIPRIPAAGPRNQPPMPREALLVGHDEIVVDLDRDGKLHIDGKPAELDALRNLLAMRQVESGAIGVTIRTDERCRFYYVRQVIRACDESAGVPYKLRSLPEQGGVQSS
jgi:hypothetical protein